MYETSDGLTTVNIVFFGTFLSFDAEVAKYCNLCCTYMLSIVAIYIMKSWHLVVRAAARVRSRAATHDVTEEEVTAWEK